MDGIHSPVWRDHGRQGGDEGPKEDLEADGDVEDEPVQHRYQSIESAIGIRDRRIRR